MRRWTTILLALLALACGRAVDLPPPDSPLRLLDLRWLAREPETPPLLVNTWVEPAEAAPTDDLFTIAHLDGPGVVQHLMLGDDTRWVIVVDGQAVYDGDAVSDWRRTPYDVTQRGEGERPWAWPVTYSSDSTGEFILPIPFAEMFEVRASRATARLWLAGTRLAGPPSRRFGGDTWRTEVDRVYAAFTKSWSTNGPVPGSRSLVVDGFTDPGGVASLLELDGAGEVVGLDFDIQPPYVNRLRYLVVTITPDGAAAPTLRLPLTDLLGSMHPFFVGWAWTHGTWPVGFSNCRWHESTLHGWFHLPIPYREGLRIELANRHPSLPLAVHARVEFVPGDPGTTARLCGTRRALDLPRAAGETELLPFPAPGRLAMLALFTTGHQELWSELGKWRADHRIELISGDDWVTAAGPPLFPLAIMPNGNPKYVYPVWSQSSWQRRERMGGTRGFWRDPLPLTAGSRLTYTGGGPGGADRGEVAAIWYQDDTYAAPGLPPGVEPLPPYHQGRPPAEEPGGWSVEAEDLLPRAVASAGEVYVERDVALDLGAGEDGLLAWNAPAVGDVLDLFVTTPPTRYVSVWVRAPELPGGGNFGVRLVPAGREAVAPLWAPGDRDYLQRVLGNVQLPHGLHLAREFPLNHQYGNIHPGYHLNPAPGGLARLRFVAAPAVGHFLPLDQIAMNPAPPPPAGWHEAEDLTATTAGSVSVMPMAIGRADFHGWGGLEVVAHGHGRADVVLPTGITALRGVATGDWTAAVGDGEPVPLTGDAEAPALWELSPGGAPAYLSIRCRSAEGRLLLDGWRQTVMAEQ